jgi:hypothetical protein
VVQVTRRDFNRGAGISVATLALPRKASAGRLLRGSAPPPGRLAQVNFQDGGFGIDFPWINCMKGSVGFEPTGGTPTADPWALFDSDGYPTAICPGTSAWRIDCYIYYNGQESYFSGSVSGTTLTVTGTVTGVPLFIGQTITQTLGGTALTAQSRITAFGTGSGGAGTYTLSQSSSSTGTINMQGFVPWVVDWAGNVGSPLVTASSNGATNVQGVAIGSNRVEMNVSAVNLSGATFTLNLTAGSTTATLSNIVGTLYPQMPISGPGIPPFTVLGSGSGTSWPIVFSGNGSLSYNLTNVSVTGAGLTPACFGFGGNPLVDVTVEFFTITTTPSNLRCYRQDEEALQNLGQITAPHAINYYQPYGRVRYLNYLDTNGCMLANWEDRTPSTYVSWVGQQNLLSYSSKYVGLCAANSNNAYVGLSALPGNPSSWADKTTVQFSCTNCPSTAQFVGFISNGSGGAGNTLTVSSVVSGALRVGLSIYGLNSNNSFGGPCNITAGSGTSWTVDGPALLTSSGGLLAYANITGFSNANPAVVQCPSHGFTTGQYVMLPPGAIVSSGGSTSIDAGINSPGGYSGTNWSQTYEITVVDSNHFSLNGVNSTSWGTWSSGGVVIPQITFKTGNLPAVPIASVSAGSFYINAGQMNAFTQSFLHGVYDATLGVLMIANITNNTLQLGMPYEMAVQSTNELNGPDMWMSVPHLATNAFVTSLATYNKANLNKRWCAERSNEVWNTGNGFYQTEYANAYGLTAWSISDGSQVSQWFGWAFYNMVQAINGVYGTGNSQVQRIFSYSTSGLYQSTQRAEAPQTGVASHPLSLADSLCFSDYHGFNSGNQTLPLAEDIYDYQQGVLTNNNTLIQSALNNIDAAFNAPTAGFLFGPITASIDNGSGGAGNILTVTALSQGNDPVNPSPTLGAYTVLSAYGASNPAPGTCILSQLSGTTGGVGTYQLAGPAQLIASTTFTAIGGSFWGLINVYIPAFKTLASTYGVAEICNYEGGFGLLPLYSSAWTSYSGNPLNLQDSLNLCVAYQESQQYATSYLNYLHAAKGLGLKYSSAYASNAAIPNAGNMFAMQYGGIFGTPTLGKSAAFDVYNAGN